MLLPSTCVGLRYGHSPLNLRSFSRQPGLTHLWPCGTAYSSAQTAAFPAALSTSLLRTDRVHLAGWAIPLRHSFVRTSGHGMLTVCPSPTARALGLGPTNPTRITLASEPSDLRRRRFSRRLRYSSQHSHFWPLQPSSPSTFAAARTLLYHPLPLAEVGIRGFGVTLEPRYIFRTGSLDQ